MDIHEIFVSQYLAGLEMLEQPIRLCPAHLWNSPEDKTKFWHIAYHVLFFTYLYLQDSEQSFRHWSGHRKGYQFLGKLPGSPGEETAEREPYAKEAILGYLALCRNEIVQRVPLIDLMAESGFHWLPFSKLELQVYNIRHLQQHTGELMERLGSREGTEMDWVIRGNLPS